MKYWCVFYIANYAPGSLLSCLNAYFTKDFDDSREAISFKDKLNTRLKENNCFSSLFIVSSQGSPFLKEFKNVYY